MQIDKAMILDMLKSKGQGDTAQQADAQLPATVDTDQHQDLLSKLGINVGDLAGLAGGLGGLGGIAGKLGI